MKTNKIKNNKGFVILFAVTLASILLTIALGVANIAFQEVVFGTSAKDTNNAFFAADTGIECALSNDKSSSVSFVESGGSGNVSCQGGTITLNGGYPFWDFNITGLGSNGASCAKVTVDKTDSSVTTIISKGYNIGDASCASVNSDRVERELKTTYYTSSPPTFTVDTAGTLTNSLAAYWKLDESSGTRVDSRGGNSLTSNNGVGQSLANKVGNSATFVPTSSQFLSSASSAMQVGDSSFTFAGWFYLNSKAAGIIGFGKDNGTATEREYRLRYLSSSDRFDFAVYTPSVGQITVTANSFGGISTGTWYFVTAWHDSGADTVNISVYDPAHPNGSLDFTATGGPLQTTTNASLFTVGSRQFPGSQNYWDGRIDELGFWKRVLTAQERTDLYNSGNGNTYNP